MLLLVVVSQQCLTPPRECVDVIDAIFSPNTTSYLERQQ